MSKRFWMMIGILALFLFTCTANLTGPKGDPGPGKLEVYNGFLQNNLYSGNAWQIPVTIPDTTVVDCRLRSTQGSPWEEPYQWNYSSSLVRIVDSVKTYNGYEYKITVVSPND